MKRSITIGLVIAVVFCAPCFAGVPESLVGRWVIAPDSKSSVSAGCADSSLEFTRDNRLRVSSGALIYSNAIEIDPKEDGFLVSVRFLTHNSKPNCQGISAEFVTTHVAPLIFVRPIANKLVYFMLDKNLKQYGPAIEFKRVEAQQTIPADRPKTGSG